MEYFVKKDSIVREIWGKSDIILFIFAGASAEFALNKAVDWLYFTGRLPADPLGRLFSTVSYARQIVFSDLETANNAIYKISAIHSAVESSRGDIIPDWAYRDVLFMLIDYSIRSYELLERKLSITEIQETFEVFYRVGKRMKLKGLPDNYNDWELMRASHLNADLKKSNFTEDLYNQYKKHLGSFRYKLLLEAQKLVVPAHVKKLLQLGKFSILEPVVFPYKIAKKFKIDWVIKLLLLPSKYRSEIKELDNLPE